jgi:4-amino-4-deoxy-L-arabinose transferase-like glycosyltransferase
MRSLIFRKDVSESESIAPEAPASVSGWEWLAVSFAASATLVLGFSNLGGPSLWHDELIHVFVAKGILEHGLPLLLGGTVFTEGTLYNYLLALQILIFGDGEFAVRAPSVLFAALNVVLIYVLCRRLLGTPTAIVAAWALALSPWSIAWARQARFYTLQQTFFLVMLYALWRATEARGRKEMFWWGAATLLGYVGGLLSGPHSIFFLAPAGAYLGIRLLQARNLKSRWTLMLAVLGLAGILTLAGYFLTLPTAEYDAIFKEAQIGGKPPNPKDWDQSDSLYYFRFFTNNLSTGYFILACIGIVWMAGREGRRGLFAALAILVPVLVLNYLIGYRRHRFMFFAYPFYVSAFSYAMVRLALFLTTWRRSWIRMAAAILIVVFAARLTVSTARLLEDTLQFAGGADATLAVVHPQWRKPCHYVRDRLDGAVVLCTTYITARYYVGQVDNWFPSRVVVWEVIESGLEGLSTLDDLKTYVLEHPKGYFIAEYRRFHHWPFFDEDEAWVEANMTRIDEASSDDVFVYAWGM